MSPVTSPFASPVMSPFASPVVSPFFVWAVMSPFAVPAPPHARAYERAVAALCESA